MKPHPLDPIALIAGLIAMIAGLIAVLHQSGVISLNLGLVIVFALMALGVGGAALVVLENRRRTRVTTKADW